LLREDNTKFAVLGSQAGLMEEGWV